MLINEVGSIDVDSLLVNAKQVSALRRYMKQRNLVPLPTVIALQNNAAVGLPAADLSGGCICCSKQEDLHGTLASMRSSAARPDFLVSH